MGFALIAFLLVSTTILGGYYVVTVMPGRMATRRLDHRLREVAMSDETLVAPEDELVRRTLKGPIPVVDRLMEGTWLSRLIEQSGVQTTPSLILIVSIVVSAVLGLTVWFITSRPYLPPIFAALGFLAPTFFLMRRRTWRFHKF